MKRKCSSSVKLRLPFHFVTMGTLAILFLASCCNQKDEVSWPPDEAVRYYNDHDTVKYYCPDTDVYESYMVCNRDSSLSIEQFHTNRFCEYAVYKHSLRYILNLDSCGGSKYIMVFIDTPNPGNIRVSIYQPDSDHGGSHVSFDEITKFSIDIEGYTYNNVIEIPGSESPEMPSILFTYEYGVIQIEYENQTFSLVNEERK